MGEKNQGVENIGVVLADLDRGRFLGECTKRFAEMMLFLRDYAMDNKRRAKGRMTMKVNVTVDDSGLACLDPEVEIRQPKPLRAGEAYFIDKRGGVTRNNPRQQELFGGGLREVPHDPNTGEVREPGARSQGESAK